MGSDIDGMNMGVRPESVDGLHFISYCAAMSGDT